LRAKALAQGTRLTVNHMLQKPQSLLVKSHHKPQYERKGLPIWIGNLAVSAGLKPFEFWYSVGFDIAPAAAVLQELHL